jgi:glycosyltransferase involved in cell wall biosynthesis
MLIAVDGNEANIKQRVGSNQYAFELLKALYQLKNPHQWVIYLREKPLDDLPRARKNWSYRVFGPKKFWTQWRLPLDLYLHRPRPDIFFSPGHYSPRFCPMPLVVSIMDLGYLQFPEQFTQKDLYQLTNWTAHSIKKASHLFAISESTKNDIINYYGISRDKVTVTYLGYDKQRFKDQVSSIKIDRIKKKYNIEGDYILFLSTLKPGKNIEGLIEAFKLVISDQWSVARKKSPVTLPAQAVSHQSLLTLVVAGKKGWLYENIFEKVKELGLEKRVVFTGFVDEEDVSALMSGAKVFVMPSFWEGFGIPAVNAMACGVPVVVSNAGSLPEVVGNAGIIVNPYKPEEMARGIEKAIENRDELVKKGLEQVKKFSWEKCARKTLKVLEKIGKK